MALRRTRVTLSIPWNDEDHEHPAQWGYEVLLGLEEMVEPVIVVDFQDINEKGEPV